MINVLEVLNKFEEEGKGFFQRNAKNFTVFVRGAHGNDPMQWKNAQDLQTSLGIFGGSIEPDPQSGHLVMHVRFNKEGVK